MSRARQRPSEAGFSLVELMVAVFLMVLILVMILSLFEFNRTLSRVQTQIADMQQSLRIGQQQMVGLVRMTGRGGLPLGNLQAGLGGVPGQGVAVGVSQNVGDDVTIVDDTSPGIPTVLPGTDVLTIRGVFNSPLYLVGGVPLAGNSITITNPATAAARIPQDLEPLKKIVADARPDALLLMGPLGQGQFAVVELNPSQSSVASDSVTLAFLTASGTHTTEYGQINGGAGLPGAVAFIGILEEYRFYVREDFAVPNDQTSDLTPKLSRARVFPNTEVAWANDQANLREDISDNIFDLQVAMAFGVPGANLQETQDGENDDWLGNGVGDNINDPRFANQPFFLRVTTWARTDRPDPRYQAPVLVRTENRVWPGNSPFNQREARTYRRRFLQTVVDLRNLG